MSEHYSELLNKTRSKRKDQNKTNELIRKMKTQAPVLSTILDYGGNESIDSLLHLNHDDLHSKVENGFDRILNTSQQSNNGDNLNRKNVSFLEYKASPVKHKEEETNKKRNVPSESKKEHKSMIVEMPAQLKMLRSEIVSLPSIAHSRYSNQESLQGQSKIGSRISLKKDLSRRFKKIKTEVSVNENKNKSSTERESYLMNMKGIFNELESPQVQCNSHFLGHYNECKRILNEEEALEKRYRRFEKLGSPPKKIIALVDCVGDFQHGVNHSLDQELMHQVSHMDEKRYNLVLKHEEMKRKVNMAKFMEKKKREKLEQFKLVSIENERLKNIESFKINSRGKAIFSNPKKNMPQ